MFVQFCRELINLYGVIETGQKKNVIVPPDSSNFLNPIVGVRLESIIQHGFPCRHGPDNPGKQKEHQGNKV